MVEEELHAINEVKDASMSIREFNKIKYLPPKHHSRIEGRLLNSILSLKGRRR